MLLYLLRHGQAGTSDHSKPADLNRPLTEKGHQQAENAARILKAVNLLPDIVITSPVLRARQTAESFTLAAGMPGPIIQSWLSCGMAPETALAELSAFPDFERVLIVGHEPDFSQLIHHTLGGWVIVKKGSLTALEIHPPSRRATLHFLLPQKLSKHLE